MLVTQHPVFRRFWYPTLRLDELEAGPKPFTLLGQDIVLWRQADGTPAALADRCPHRSAKLSVDSMVVDGSLRCGYHGWGFDGAGTCVLIPQMPGHKPGPRSSVATFHAQARYGYAWVCLDEPLAGIPDLPYADDPGYRQVFEYDQDWNANTFRICENALDVTHVSFVHRKTFGQLDKPVAPRLTILPMEDGVNFQCLLPVANHALQQRNLRIAANETVRQVDIKWLLPSIFLLRFVYPNGLVHQICGFATPIDDRRSRRIQFAFRNDTEADAPAADIAAFDRSVGQEDRAILESTDPDFPLAPKAEAHMTLDRPGLIMREKLRSLIERHDQPARLAEPA